MGQPAGSDDRLAVGGGEGGGLCLVAVASGHGREKEVAGGCVALVTSSRLL
jgi:hypothetical protein